MVTLQELHTAAEPLRQNEVKIAVLKMEIWNATVAWIQSTEYAQTDAVPAGSNKWATTSTKKKNKSDWVPDPLYEAVEKAMPHESELTIEANRYVEADLMPIFASGMPVDFVQEQHTNKWNADIQD